jgi:hypothetical protein
VCAAACSRPSAEPPRAEFLLASEDSTFWVESSREGVHVRGVPILLARYDGRFYELYTAEQDFSYNDALLLGERLYRRDIMSGDSLPLFADTTVARVAAAYARAHPDEAPLRPDQEGEANPGTSASASVDVLGVFGPYISYEYHVDIDLPGSRPWHSTRRGVIDLRTGTGLGLADLFGPQIGGDLARQGREHYLATRDSILAERAALKGDDRRAADALLRLEFDERSFTISSANGKPAIAFDVPGRGEGAAGDVVELEQITLEPTPWWRDIASSFPVTTAQGDDRWEHASYHVLARYDTSGKLAGVTLGDTTRREWLVATIMGPLRQITWLDRPAIADPDRAALRKAFNAAASYDETSRVASHSALLSSSFSRYANFKESQRKPARNVRAHDARACEQHGPRVRRCHSVDDGQVRRDLRLSSQPRGGGHRVDRPRRLSRADSPRRPGGHEGQRQLRRQDVDGSRRSR